MKNALKTAFLVCASLIGAGFASGREIMEFFPPKGYAGLIAANFSVILICFVMYTVLKSGGKVCNNTLYIWGVTLFSVCILSVMLAGGEQLFQNGRYIMAGIVLITVFFGIRGIENVSVLLCPAMILFIILFGIEGIGRGEVLKTTFKSSPFLYAGYNVLSLPVLLRKCECQRPLTASVITAAVMMPLISIVYLASSGFSSCEMPFASAVDGGAFMVLMLGMAMYTTAVCSGFCLCDITGGGRITAVITMLIALVCSFTGFGQLISNGYRTFGFAGIITACYEISFMRKNEKNHEFLRKQRLS